MLPTSYRNRRAFLIENEVLRVTVLAEGGHIAEIFHKGSGINPLWTPPWPSIEPSAYSPAKHPGYGADAESKLLAGIMGHNLCLDVFGPVSGEEAAAGLTVHGEASVAAYDASGDTIHATFPHAQLRFERRIALDGSTVGFTETVENLTACDRPVGWTEHVTLGPPFLSKGETVFELTAGRSKVFEGDFGDGSYMTPGAEFEWPHAPRLGGGAVDLRTFTNLPASAAFTTHLMSAEDASFTARTGSLTFGYRWKRSDFPWCGIWEENYARTGPPWNGRTLTRGIEFGVSPFPETRRSMIERGSLFGVPAFRWIPARGSVTVRYEAFVEDGF
jgi:hypothetical protein